MEDFKGQTLGKLTVLKKPKNNKSGTRGVVKRNVKGYEYWYAYISVQGKIISLGYHDTLEEAEKARKEAEEKYLNPVLDKNKDIQIYRQVLEGKINKAPRGFWTLERAKIALKWLVEEKYKINDEELKKVFQHKWLIENKLSSPLLLFNRSAFDYIDYVYPNKFKPWDFPKNIHNYWTDNTVIEAIQWLILDKIHGLDPQKISLNLLKENGLTGVYKYCGCNMYDVINMVFPDKYKEWEFFRVNHWTEEKANAAIKWLKEKYPDQQLTEKHFRDNGLYGLFNKYYNYSIENVEKGLFKYRQDRKRKKE